MRAGRTTDGPGFRYVAPRHIVVDTNPVPTPFWEPPAGLFAGQTVVIVGGGPSHADIDLEVLRGHRLIAINSSCRKARSIATADDWLWFHDNNWNEQFPQLARDWPGVVASPNRNVKARLGDAVKRIDLAALTEAIGTLPDHVQASSGHSAACIAATLGAKRIVLIGFECKLIDGRSHGHNDYAMSSTNAFEERFLPGWRALAVAIAERRGVEIINATPDSAITVFPRMTMRDALGERIVASFFAPRFDKWGCDYDALLRLLDASCKRLGLRHVSISDRPRPGVETALYDLPENLMAAFVDGQRQFLEDRPRDRVLFVGADSVLTRDPFAAAPDCDLAVTMGPFSDCPMNNGFLLANRPDRCAPVWADALARKPTAWGDDQRCQLAAFEASDLRIDRLRCEDHNWAPEHVNDAVMPTVVHFRGDRKAWMAEWCRRHLGLTV